MKHVVYLLVAFACHFPLMAQAEEAAAIEGRLAATVRYLAADTLGGRGLGTPEIDAAASYVRDQLASTGLRMDAVEGGAFQEFEVTTASRLGEQGTLTLLGSGLSHPYMLGQDYTPLAIGGAGQIDAPIVFAGYGITAPEANYDDYAAIDVTGKIVIVLRHEPDQANPHSLFNGTEPSVHAPFRAKVINASQHGAAAVVFVTDKAELDRTRAQYRRRREAASEDVAQLEQELNNSANASAEQVARIESRLARQQRRVAELAEQEAELTDSLLPFEGAGNTSDRDMPVLFASRGAVERLLAQAGATSLEQWETEVDRTLAPRSFELSGYNLAGRVDIIRDRVPARNIVAVLDGHGHLADETVIIGAHYDHVGRGGAGSGAADPSLREIHNGADDNASGVAVLIEVARALAAQPTPPARRVVFVAFTGEERGLLGSAHYVAEPVFPLASTVAMLNLDMVGRLADNRCIVNGTDTASEFPAWIDAANQRAGFDLAQVPGGFGPSDHASFYAQKVPVLHFFTGLHEDYHRPSDDTQLLNVAGMRRMAEFVTDLAQQVVESPQRPTYHEASGPSMQGEKVGTRPYFGSIPDFAQATPGYALSGVAPESPAADAGLQAGDVIVGLGDLTIGNLDDFDSGLRKFQAGDRVKVTLLRDGSRIEVEVVLDPSR